MPAKVASRFPAPDVGQPTRDAAPSQKSAVGYTSGAGFDGPEAQLQRERIKGACRDLGLVLVDLVHDKVPDGRDSDARPGLRHILDRIDSGEVGCLIVSELERLSSNVAELDEVLARMEGGDRRLIALDIELDTDTPVGKLAVSPRAGARREPEPALVVEAEEPAPPPLAAPPRIHGARTLGYASVPADEDGVAQALEEQAEIIEAACGRLGLSLVEVVSERTAKAGKALDRAGVSYLVERLAAGDASCVVVTGLDRLSHSVAELGRLVEWLSTSEVRLVAVELGLDTANPEGQTAARALASVAGWEQERVSERTRKGLAAARAKRGERGDASEPDWTAVRERIALMRADGMTLQAIADVLNEEGVPTVRGGATWRPSSVQTAAGYKRRRRQAGVADLPAPRRKPN
jgi:DNA invertase Pin-like site-specific DNA recombinase